MQNKNPITKRKCMANVSQNSTNSNYFLIDGHLGGCMSGLT